jgi:hypothetical protein
VSKDLPSEINQTAIASGIVKRRRDFDINGVELTNDKFLKDLENWEKQKGKIACLPLQLSKVAEKRELPEEEGLESSSEDDSEDNSEFDTDFKPVKLVCGLKEMEKEDEKKQKQKRKRKREKENTEIKGRKENKSEVPEDSEGKKKYTLRKSK